MRSLTLFTILFIHFLISSCSDERKTKSVEVININDGWEFRQMDSSTWSPAKVPGCVHTDLFSNKLITDPYLAANEDSLQWIGKTDWEYKTNFEVDNSLIQYNKLELLFDGLDTYADVYLNDSLIVTSNNMYRTWMYNCKDIIQPGTNELKIHFKSPIAEARPFWKKYNGAFPAVNEKTDSIFSVYTRKAPYHYGWDWGPRFVTMGIWKPIKLIAWNEAKLEDTYLRKLFVDKSKALYSNHVEVNSSFTQKGRIEIEVSTPYNIDGVTQPGSVLLTKEENIEISTGHNFYKIDFEINNPLLWWPNGYGEQPLYDITTKLIVENELIESSTERLGIKDLEFVQEGDSSSGSSFYFKINNTPIFMKGANYIPQEVFTPSVTQARYERLINDAVASNMNMFRVWGGAIYEKDEFYDLCDEKGIMIWQDFMFACAFYPGDDTLAYTIKKEAVDNVKRLRDHTCIALWCGNNEIAHGWDAWGWSKKYAKDSALLWTSYHRIFNNILPDVVESYSPDIPYIHTSPLNKDDNNFSITSGDHHEWKIWFGRKPFSSYNDRIGRFMSEYGFQSYPEASLCKKMTASDSLDLNSEILRSHQKCHMDWYKSNYTGNELIKDYMEMYYDIPLGAESYITLSQFLQADALKTAIEAHRRNQPKCMGSLYWQIDDCWPSISWATIDYEGQWKYAHYKVKNGYKRVTIDCYEHNDTILVYGVSDRRDTLEAQLNFKLQEFNGVKYIDTSLYVSIPPSGASILYKTLKSTFINRYNQNYVAASAHLSLYRDYIDDDVLFFEKPKNLRLQKAAIDSKVREIQGGYMIELSSDTLIKGVYIDAGPKGRNCFSDNYIDLVPGEKRTIKFTQEPLTTKSSEIEIKQLLELY